jgi:hypothetical protein
LAAHDDEVLDAAVQKTGGEKFASGRRHHGVALPKFVVVGEEALDACQNLLI